LLRGVREGIRTCHFFDSALTGDPFSLTFDSGFGVPEELEREHLRMEDRASRRYL